MILYYALGGGYGHFIRAVDFLHTVFPTKQAIIWCSQIPKGAHNQTPHKLIEVETFTTDTHTPAGLINQLEHIISDNNIDHLIIDTFPFGILNELAEINLSGLKLSHVARYIKPKIFESLTENESEIQFHNTYFVEKPSEAQLLFLQQCSRNTREIQLQNFNYKLDTFFENILTTSVVLKILVVHSGNREELEVLLNFAHDLKKQLTDSCSIFCVSPNQIDTKNMTSLAIFPAHAYYHLFDYVVSGAGFNAVRFAHRAQKKSYLIPFERRYDDQFWRLHEFRKTII